MSPPFAPPWGKKGIGTESFQQGALIQNLKDSNNEKTESQKVLITLENYELNPGIFLQV